MFARLLLVALVPMAGLQFAALRELQRQGDISRGADTAAREMAVLQQVGTVIPPLYAEFTATLGIAQAESLGIDRATVAEAIGVDFLAIVATARTAMDEGLDALERGTGAQVLTSGDTVSSALNRARAAITTVRTEFDRGGESVDEITSAFDGLAGLLDDVRRMATSAIRPAEVTPELTRLGAATDQLLLALDHATAELRHVAAAGMAMSDDAPVSELMMAAGAFDAAINQLGDFLDADQQAALGSLVHSKSFTDVSVHRPGFVTVVSGIEGGDSTLEGDGNAVTVIVDMMLASFQRLDDLQEFSGQLLRHDASRAAKISDDAHQRYLVALGAMIAAAVVSLLLLALVLRSILRPLTRLAEQAEQVIHGDLGVAPVQPTGPTDIRVVTRTFNDMVATLRDYDQQVSRLAAGVTDLDTSLPGALGDTVRRSVTHLARSTPPPTPSGPRCN